MPNLRWTRQGVVKATGVELVNPSAVTLRKRFAFSNTLTHTRTQYTVQTLVYMEINMSYLSLEGGALV